MPWVQKTTNKKNNEIEQTSRWFLGHMLNTKSCKSMLCVLMLNNVIIIWKSLLAYYYYYYYYYSYYIFILYIIFTFMSHGCIVLSIEIEHINMYLSVANVSLMSYHGIVGFIYRWNSCIHIQQGGHNLKKKTWKPGISRPCLPDLVTPYMWAHALKLF